MGNSGEQRGVWLCFCFCLQCGNPGMRKSTLSKVLGSNRGPEVSITKQLGQCAVLPSVVMAPVSTVVVTELCGLSSWKASSSPVTRLQLFCVPSPHHGPSSTRLLREF